MTGLGVPPPPVSGGVYVQQDDLAAVASAVAAARAPSTRRVYASAWRAWTLWCSSHGYSELPADPVHVAAHVAWLAAQGRAVSTIDRALAAIAAKHVSAGLDGPTHSPGVRLTRSGVRRTVGAAPRRQAHPLTTDELRRLVDTCDPGSLRGARDRTLLLVGYAAALRRSELGTLALGAIAYRSAGIALTLNRTKSDQEGAGTVIGIARGHGPTDPVRAVRNWTAAAGICDPLEPLFPRIAWSDRRALRGRPLSPQRTQPASRPRDNRCGSGCSRGPDRAHDPARQARNPGTLRAAERGTSRQFVQRTGALVLEQQQSRSRSQPAPRSVCPGAAPAASSRSPSPRHAANPRRPEVSHRLLALNFPGPVR